MNLETVFTFDKDIFPWIVEKVKRKYRKKDVQPGNYIPINTELTSQL